MPTYIVLHDGQKIIESRKTQKS